MAQSPEELRREIERTREDMSRDVDAISDKVSPSRIVQRRVDRTKGRLSSIGERVMGTASAGTDKLTGSASNARSGISEAVTGAPDAAISRAQGNPLAAGLLVFAAGWMLGSLLPASEAETNAARALEDKVKEPLKQELSDAARDMKDNLQGPAQEAVQSVKETATDSAQTVAEQGKDSAQNVKSQAQESTSNGRQSAGTASTI